MIQKMSSTELNTMLLQTGNEINELDSNVELLKSDLEKKLSIVNFENLYINDRMQEISKNIIVPKNNFISFSSSCPGNFSCFGYSVHPKFIKTPLNVFNISLNNGNIFFRNDVTATTTTVYTNASNVVSTDNSFLKQDSLPDKTIFFKQFDTNNIELTITADTNNPLGPTLFNTIEIDSFLPGSYDIKDILFTYYDDKGDKNTNKSIKEIISTYRGLAAVNENLITDAGKNRLVLPSKVSLLNITFKIKLKYAYNVNGTMVYPFGLNHIYFYDADYDIASKSVNGVEVYDSYAVATFTSNNFIDTIHDDIILSSTIGDINSTLTQENIVIYADNINGVLSTPIYTGESIPRNLNKVYISLPLYKLESIVGIGLYIDTK